MHVEKVIKIITNDEISPSICNQIMHHFILKEMKNLNDDEMQNHDVSEDLKMLGLIMKSLKSDRIYKSLAFSLLTVENAQAKSLEILPAACDIVRSIANLPEREFDGFKLAEEIINFRSQKNKRLDARALSRLICECIIMMAPQFALNSNIQPQYLDAEVVFAFSKKLLGLKKVLLPWFLSQDVESVLSNDRGDTNHDEVDSQQMNHPEFDSILDGDFIEDNNGDSSFDVLRCCMFLMQPSAHSMKLFFNLGMGKGTENKNVDLSEDVVNRISFCVNFGCGIDDDLLHIIIESVTMHSRAIDAKKAISLIELIMYNCRDKKDALFEVNDSEVIWDLYKLTEYVPKVSQTPK